MDVKCTLKDCGFDSDIADEYADAVKAQDYSRQLRALEKQRRLMLDEMHAATKKVDCIDFMICECKRKMK